MRIPPVCKLLVTSAVFFGLLAHAQQSAPADETPPAQPETTWTEVINCRLATAQAQELASKTAWDDRAIQSVSYTDLILFQKVVGGNHEIFPRYYMSMRYRDSQDRPISGVRSRPVYRLAVNHSFGVTSIAYHPASSNTATPGFQIQVRPGGDSGLAYFQETRSPQGAQSGATANGGIEVLDERTTTDRPITCQLIREPKEKFTPIDLAWLDDQTDEVQHDVLSNLATRSWAFRDGYREPKTLSDTVQASLLTTLADFLNDQLPDRNSYGSPMPADYEPEYEAGEYCGEAEFREVYQIRDLSGKVVGYTIGVRCKNELDDRNRKVMAKKIITDRNGKLLSQSLSESQLALGRYWFYSW